MSALAKFSVGLFALAAIACASEPPAPTPQGAADSSWEGTIEERNGVVSVTNPTAGLWDHAATPPLVFEPDGVFGGPAAQISSIAGAIVDNDGNVHIFDALDAQLVKLAGDGSVLHRSGSAGEGAQQFHSVRGMAYDGVDTIYFANQAGERLDAWGTDGAYRRSIPLADLGLESAYMGGFLSPGRLALLSDTVHNMATNEYIVVSLGEQPAVEARFRIGADPMVPIPPGVVLQLSHYFSAGEILVGTWERYVLRVYDGAGQLRRRVTRPVEYLRRPGFAIRGEQYLGVSLGGLAAPIVLENGHWLVLAAWATNVDVPNTFAETPAAERPTIEWASSLDLFDPQGRFLYSLQYPGQQTPDIGRPWTVGPEGRLYTVAADPFPQVRRYRASLNPPDTR